MKPAVTKFAKSKPRVFKTATPKPVAAPKAAATGKPVKRDNIFSKSRDTREDRGTRQAKTKQNSQTFPHAR